MSLGDSMILGGLLLGVCGFGAMLFWRGKRKYGLLCLPVAFVVMVVGGVVSSSELKASRALGFASVDDHRDAQKAGVEDAAAWQALREERAARAAIALRELRERQEQERVRQATELATRQAEREIEAERQAVRLAAEREAQQAQRAADAARQEAFRVEREQREAAERVVREREAAAEAARCRTELRCWAERNAPRADVACRRPIENLARTDFQWTNGWLEPRLSRFRWLNQRGGTITYVGDAIQFQNGLGAWVRHIYQCDFDPGGERVLQLRAEMGRLPN